MKVKEKISPGEKAAYYRVAKAFDPEIKAEFLSARQKGGTEHPVPDWALNRSTLHSERGEIYASLRFDVGGMAMDIAISPINSYISAPTATAIWRITSRFLTPGEEGGSPMWCGPSLAAQWIDWED